MNQVFRLYTNILKISCTVHYYVSGVHLDANQGASVITCRVHLRNKYCIPDDFTCFKLFPYCIHGPSRRNSYCGFFFPASGNHKGRKQA